MGPLNGLQVVELGGIGPGPMGAMLLADLGATVLRIDRKEPAGLGVPRPARFDLLLRIGQALLNRVVNSGGVCRSCNLWFLRYPDCLHVNPLVEDAAPIAGLRRARRKYRSGHA